MRILKIINKTHRIPIDDNENHENLSIHVRIKKIMKIIEFHATIMKTMKVVELNARIMKIMKTVEFHARI